MARVKKCDVPHNFKERVRHQKLQEILEQLGKKVPNRQTQKKEAKDRKLRRIILYVKYLLKKVPVCKSRSYSCPFESGMAVAEKIIRKCRSKRNNNNLKVCPLSEKICHKAQIVYLKKSDPVCVSESQNPEPDLQENYMSTDKRNDTTNVNGYDEPKYNPNGDPAYCMIEQDCCTRTLKSYLHLRNKTLFNSNQSSTCSTVTSETNNFCGNGSVDSSNKIKNSINLPPISNFLPSYAICDNSHPPQYFETGSKEIKSMPVETVEKVDASTMCDISSPEDQYSNDLFSPEETDFISSSNEWLSDDTHTDSDSFARSGSFESPILPSGPATFSNPYLRSPGNSSLNCDIYPLSVEKICDLSAFVAPVNSSQEMSKTSYYNEETNGMCNCNVSRNGETYSAINGFPIKAEPLFVSHSNEANDCFQQNCESHNCYVPSYGCKVPLHSNEIKKTTNFMPKEYECGYYTELPSLPENEISYSFNNFKQWYPGNNH